MWPLAYVMEEHSSLYATAETSGKQRYLCRDLSTEETKMHLGTFRDAGIENSNGWSRKDTGTSFFFKFTVM